MYHISPSTGNPNICRATEGNCPFVGSDEHYETKAEARDAYEAKMEAGTEVGEQLVSHDEPETLATGNGNTFSKVTKQANGTLIQTVNGQTIVIGKKNSAGSHRIFLADKAIGTVTQDVKAGRWDLTYADGQPGRRKKWPVDAMAALLKKANPAPRAKVEEPAPGSGYDPGRHSELKLYEDFPTPKEMTRGRLRRMTSQDLAHMHNRLERSISQSGYGKEISASLAAQARVSAVLGERGDALEVKEWGQLQPGKDYGDPSTYGLVDRADPLEDAKVPCDDAHDARIARLGHCRKCGGSK